MRKTFLALLATLAITLSPADAADFQKGLDAYNNGDYVAALKEWKPLAEQGDAIAQSNLGQMYRNGLGVPQDHKQAVKWYRLAAEQGDAAAQYFLGWMYANGLGVPQDYIMAYMWFNLAAANGDKGAVKNRDIVAKLLTPADLGKAQELSRACLASSYKNCGN